MFVNYNDITASTHLLLNFYKSLFWVYMNDTDITASSHLLLKFYRADLNLPVSFMWITMIFPQANLNLYVELFDDMTAILSMWNLFISCSSAEYVFYSV